MANWAQKNPKVFTIIAGTIGAIALAITAVNIAMALNPFGAIAVGIGILVTGIGIAYTQFEGFRNLVRNVVNGLSDYFEFMANNWIKATNILIKGINLISPFKDIPLMGSVSFGKIGDDPRYTNSRQAEQAMFGGSGSGAVSVSAAAPTAPRSIPQTPSSRTTAPPSGLGGGNGGTDFGLGNISFTDMPLPPMTINIDAGLISSPATVGEDIISAILAAQRNSGTVFAPASGL
jgi:phage-related protein